MSEQLSAVGPTQKTTKKIMNTPIMLIKINRVN